MPIRTPKERLGTRIGDRYVVDALLASGGQGVLFVGTHSWTKRRVAIKFLKSHDNDPKHAARFLREARAATVVNHPHVIEMLDMGRDEDGSAYLVMELLHGHSLEQELSTRGPLSVEDALRLLLPMMGAMAKAHSCGVIHRDLKPSNVFLAEDAAGGVVPKVLDFGVAKIDGSAVTHSGAVIGTPHYMAPEQALGQPVGPQADVWAAGVIWFRCLTGRLPFVGCTPEVLMQIAHRQAPRVGDFVACDPNLEAVLARALRHTCSERYSDMATFAHELNHAVRSAGYDVPVEPDPVGLPCWDTWSQQPLSAADTLSVQTPPHGPPPMGRPHDGPAEAATARQLGGALARWSKRSSRWIAAAAVPLLGLGATLAVLAQEANEPPATTATERRAFVHTRPTAAITSARVENGASGRPLQVPPAPTHTRPKTQLTSAPPTSKPTGPEPHQPPHGRRAGRARVTAGTASAPPRSRRLAGDAATRRTTASVNAADIPALVTDW